MRNHNAFRENITGRTYICMNICIPIRHVREKIYMYQSDNPHSTLAISSSSAPASVCSFITNYLLFSLLHYHYPLLYTPYLLAAPPHAIIYLIPPSTSFHPPFLHLSFLSPSPSGSQTIHWRQSFALMAPLNGRRKS